MKKLSFSEKPTTEYVVFKEKKEESPFITVNQKYPEKIYVSRPTKMPLVFQTFFGGISIVGLYIIYRFIEKNTKK